MKHRMLCVLLVCLLTTGCTQAVKSTSRPGRPQDEQLQVAAVPRALTISASNTSLRLGDHGFITIKGQPGETYTIRTHFNMRGQRIRVTQVRVANSNGEATFNWVVNPGTDPGTYTGTISGAGETIKISHTVIP